jgi:hypothetical protein
MGICLNPRSQMREHGAPELSAVHQYATSDVGELFFDCDGGGCFF